MDWFIVGFAVVGPMSASLTMSFNRREAALMSFSQIRSYAYHIYLGHALWDWDDGRGRASCKDMDWVHHTDAAMAQLIGIGDELSRFLTLPSATRSRHRMTGAGREEAIRTMRVSPIRQNQDTASQDIASLAHSRWRMHYLIRCRPNE